MTSETKQLNTLPLDFGVDLEQLEIQLLEQLRSTTEQLLDPKEGVIVRLSWR